MYLEIIERGEKVGEVHVNPFSYTYNGGATEIENQLEEWETEGGYTTIGAASKESVEAPFVMAETRDVGDRLKLLEIGSEIAGMEVNVNLIDE